VANIPSVILDSVGVEYEWAGFPMDFIRDKVPRGWRIDRDGSLTRDVFSLGGREVELGGGRNNYNLPRTRIGGELISPICTFERVDKLIEDLNHIMTLMKEQYECISDLASVHVHIYAGQYPPLTFFKNYLMLARAIEAPVFRLSVGESPEHRGITNDDYLYCRPITGDGPQYVRDSETGMWLKAFDIDRMLAKAKTANDMIRAWCRADYQPNKWVPGRYYWTHFVSLFRQGTLEFRQFNQTLKVRYLMAWLDLSRAIVKKAWAGGCDLPQFGLGLRTPEGDTATFQYENFLEIITPDLFRLRETPETLEELWYKSMWQPAAHPQVNHLCQERSRVVPFSDVRQELRPEYVDKEFINSIWNDGHERGH